MARFCIGNEGYVGKKTRGHGKRRLEGLQIKVTLNRLDERHLWDVDGRPDANISHIGRGGKVPALIKQLSGEPLKRWDNIGKALHWWPSGNRVDIRNNLMIACTESMNPVQPPASKGASSRRSVLSPNIPRPFFKLRSLRQRLLRCASIEDTFES